MNVGEWAIATLLACESAEGTESGLAEGLCMLSDIITINELSL